MKLDYRGKLNIDNKLLECPLEQHWVGQQWYSDSFPKDSRIIVGYNDTFGIARIESPDKKTSFIGIMNIKPHLEDIVKLGNISEKEKNKKIFEVINMAQGNFDRYGPDTPLFSTSEGMVEVTNMQDIDESWFYHRHEEYEKEMEKQGVKVVKIPFTSTPVKKDSDNRNSKS